MLRPEQETWINHLSETSRIKIEPFEPTAEEKFQRVRAKIITQLGRMPVEHHGASSMGISGQDEVDVYVPTPPEMFDSRVEQMKTLFGNPRSLYPLERARFITDEMGKHVDIFIINEECEGWKTALIFEQYLRDHPEALEEYRKLKEDGDGLSVREYYRRKILFINGIIAIANSTKTEFRQ